MSENERMAITERNKVCKIILAGAGGVGKTCIASRLVTKSFIESEMTRGLDIESWDIVDESNDVSFKLVSIDLGGQMQFRFFQDSFVRGARIALVVFDVSRYESILELEEWKELLGGIDSSYILLIGNKKDLGISMDLGEIEKLKRDWQADCIIVSTKTGENFERVEEFLLSSLHRLSGKQSEEGIII